MQDYKLIVKENILQKDMYFKEQLVLSYTIKYPSFISARFRLFLRELNNYYKTQAMTYVRINIMNLYKMAIEEYEYSMANDFPVRAYEAVTDYTVTYNQNCIISLYFDKYEYTGGAHGNTIRSSDTWNLQKGNEVTLSELFTINHYQKYIIQQIKEKIKADIQKGNNYYFEDYEKLVQDNFNIQNFYLSKEGIVLYFQQYDIAPYSSGILTFTIPFTSKNVIQPTC